MHHTKKKITNVTDELGNADIGKLLFRLSVPAITAQIINLLYNLVDRMYIGHIDKIGKRALTGVGVCLPLIMIITATTVLVSMGGAPKSSIYLGSGDKEGAKKILGNSVSLLIIISVLLTVIFQCFCEELLMSFGASENTIEYALDYMLVYSMGTIFVQITLGLNPFISAQGFAKISMLTVLIGAIANIILDPIFIFTLGLGVKGAALATIISQSLSMIWILKFLTGKKATVTIERKYLKLEPKVFVPCLLLGISPFIMKSTESLLALCFNSSLYRYGGDIAVGSMTILSSVMQFSLLPLFGLTEGAQPIMSYNYGAGNAERMKKVFKLLLISALVYATTLWTVVHITPSTFVLIFNDDPALVEFASNALKIYMAVSCVFGAQLACQYSFIALGNAKSSVIVALLRKIILLIPLIYILPNVLTIVDKTTAIFMAEPIADTISVLFTVILFYFQFKKALREIPQKEHE